MITKECTGCKKDLPLENYGEYAKGEFGVKAECRKCKNEKTKSYRRTKQGLISDVYSSQRGNSRRRDHHEPKYSLNELNDWMLSKNEFHQIYDGWVDGGYLKKYRPSIDRLNPLIGYSFSNIRIVPFYLNQQQHDKDRKSGKDNRTLVPIIQLTLNGEFIKEHYSMSQAARDMGVSPVNIINCCSGKYKKSCGYRWMKKNEWEKEKGL